MAKWTKDDLDKIAAAEELELASLRRDGTLSNAVTIWAPADVTGALADLLVHTRGELQVGDNRPCA